ncbi:MAG: ABC-2 family transporter protein [Actinomycetota bacterium]
MIRSDERRALGRAVSTEAARELASPSGPAVAGVFYLMVTAVLSGLWATAASANGGEIVGYSATALVWYVATAEAATVSLPLRLIEEVGDDIASGRITSELLRPVGVLPMRIALRVGAFLPRLGVCVVVGVGFSWLVGGAPIDGLALALAVPSLLLAVSISVVAQHAFAGAAFWIADAKGAWFLWSKLVFVLGGMLLPLEVLPDTLANVAKALPFMAMAYAPARLASGHVEPWLLVVQLAWLLVAVWLAVAVFRAGERRLVEEGA